MNKPFFRPVAVVTGGARGIGLAIARWFLANDGGIAITYDAGGNFQQLQNLPIAQFYEVAYDMSVPYGVLECDGPRVRTVVEKPVVNFFVCAGIYLLEPEAHRLIPKNRRFDMTDLIHAAIEKKLRVVSFPMWEYWRDIGQHDDYLGAQADVKDGTLSR